MASISARKRANGTASWRVTFQHDGRQRQETFDTRDGASRFKRMVESIGPDEAEHVLTIRQDRERTFTLREWTAKYLDPASGLLTGVTEGTRSEYGRLARRSFLQHAIAEMPIDVIRKQDVAKWVNWQEAHKSAKTGKPAAAKTVRGYHGLLSQILFSAVESEVIPRNPARGVKISKGQSGDMVFLTPEEFRTLMCFVPEFYRPLVQFLAMTGCRWGEATALKNGDVDRSTRPGTVHIRRSWKHGKGNTMVLGIPKTSKSNRTIALDAETMDALPAGEPDGFVFRGKFSPRVGRQPFRRPWAKAVALANDPVACKAMGVKPIGKHPRVHDLRHSHASWLIAAGVPLNVIQQRLGHESITTTVDRYGHLMPDAQTVAVEALPQMKQLN